MEELPVTSLPSLLLHIVVQVYRLLAETVRGVRGVSNDEVAE